MANPYDNSINLEDVAEIVQQDYWNTFESEHTDWFGSITNKIFKPSPDRIGGDGKTMQFEYGPSDSVRFSTDTLGPFANPDVMDPGTLKVRFNKQTSATDFVRVSGSCQTNDIDLINGKYGSIVDFVQRMQAQIEQSYDESMAIHRNLDRTARLCTVSGTPTLNNGVAIDATAGVVSSGTATNAGGARFKIANGSISYFRANRKVDIYSSAGVLRAGNVRVTDTNFSDQSIGIAFQSGSTIDAQTSTGNLASVVSGDYVYLSTERNAGMWSMGSYFAAPTAGESFIGGVDRTTAAYRFLNPVTLDYSAAPTPISLSVLNTIGLAMNYMNESEQGVTIYSNPTLVQAMRNQWGEASFLNLQDGDNRLKRFANFGTMGLNYQHPTWGIVKVLSDPLMLSGQMRILLPELWRTLYYGFKGLRMMPGMGGSKPGFYRVTESTPNTGLSQIWKCDWYALTCDWCFAPWKMGVVRGLTA